MTDTRKIFTRNAATGAPAVVYHCIPVKTEGDYIRASDRYGATIPLAVREQLGIARDGNPPLVFAATHLSKAMAFGLQGWIGEKLVNSSIEGTDNEFVIACDRDALMNRVRDVTIYEILADRFALLEYADRQGVFAHDIPLAQTRIAFKATSAAELMQGGLQILTFPESGAELKGYAFVQTLMKERAHKDLYHFMADMLREGKLIWENQERGINPDQVLAARLAQHAPHALPCAAKPKR